MHSAQLRETFGSLRFRLTLWNTFVLLLLIVGTLFAVRAGLWLALLHEYDQQLRDDLSEMKLRVEESFPNLEPLQHDLERASATHSFRGLYFKLIDSGEVIWRSSRAPVLVLPHDRHGDFGPVSAYGYRIMQGQVARRGLHPLMLRVGASLQPLYNDINKLTQQLIVVGVIALLVAPAGGYWLAGRATQPLAEMIDTTNRLHPSNLNERLKLRGTRDELDRLSTTINGFLDRIHAYLEQNRQFTANAAHELRSPLAAIQSSLEVALNTDRSP